MAGAVSATSCDAIAASTPTPTATETARAIFMRFPSPFEFNARAIWQVARRVAYHKSVDEFPTKKRDDVPCLGLSLRRPETSWGGRWIVCWEGPSGVNAWSFVAGPLDVLDVGSEIRVRLRVLACLAAELEHTIAEAAQKRSESTRLNSSHG